MTLEEMLARYGEAEVTRWAETGRLVERMPAPKRSHEEETQVYLTHDQPGHWSVVRIEGYYDSCSTPTVTWGETALAALAALEAANA